MVREWSSPVSERSRTALLTSRCCSIRLMPSKCEAVTLTRRWSPPPSSITSTCDPGMAPSISVFTSSTRATSGGGLRGLGGLDHLFGPAELDARAAVRLAGLDLGGVDRLPALERDVIGLALVEQGLDRAAVGGQIGLRHHARLEILEELVDGLLRVLLVRADHAGGTALDPPNCVEPGNLVALAVVDLAGLVVNQASAFVEWDALDRDALVADGAEDHPALDRLALAGVDGTDAAVLASLQLVLPDDDPLDLAIALDLDGGAEKAERDL